MSAKSFARRQTIKSIEYSMVDARRVYERLIAAALLVCAGISILTTAGIIGVLIFETIEFLREVPLSGFMLGTVWTPLFEPAQFGVLALVVSTVVISLFAMLVSLPLGLLAAIYLSEYASPKTRGILKPALEILAGVPTVVYGYFALTFVTPLLREFLADMRVFNGLTAGLVMGIMIIPMVSSLSEDAMNAVPQSLRQAAYGLGSTKLQVTLRVVLPAALSGIVAAVVLAMSRAIGETMIVAIAAGQSTTVQLNPLYPMETMTAYIARVSLGDNPQTSLEFKTIFAVGMLLFLITFGLNLVSQRVLAKYREVHQ
ncbi:MAG: phosphate ABC transporter permease subunit PstC [Anaerolineae bacterium]|nr:phosphate ABC transporter permease subunit PstC [Anaerolineae bacterium]